MYLYNVRIYCVELEAVDFENMGKTFTTTELLSLPLSASSQELER